MDTEHGAGGLNHRKLPVEVVVLLAHQKRKVQILPVVIDRAAAGQPPGERSAVCIQHGCAAFRPSILVFADHDGALVTPQIKNAAPAESGFQQVLLDRQIAMGIDPVALLNAQRVDHAKV